MGLRYNPFTGSFDMTRSPGSYLDGEVAAYSDLPLDAAAAPLNSAWLVRAGSGLWLLTRKPAGIYIRTATGGTDRDADYTYAGTFPDVFSDANFVVYNDADSTKNLKLDTSGLTTGTTRTLTVPDASGTLPLLETANTYTQNQTLDGTNNTAPNQTAASGSSVMTRDLVAYEVGHNTNFGLAPLHGQSSGNGGAAQATYTLGLIAQTGSSNAGRGCVMTGDMFWNYLQFTGGLMPANKAVEFYIHGLTIVRAANTDWVSRIVFGQTLRTPPLPGADALSSRGWGVEFYYNGTDQVWRPFWYDSAHNVGAETVLSGGTLHTYSVKMRQDGLGLIEFTISGPSARLPDTPTYSNTVTFGANGYGGQAILLEATSNTGVAQGGSGTGFRSRAQYVRYTP
jgi:hypothetical protein